MRDDVVRLYAWCRHCDDVVDGQDMGGELTRLTTSDQRLRLLALRDDTAAALDSNEALAPPFEALRAVAREHDFPRRWPFDLLEGFRMDVDRAVYRTFDDLALYSYHVAGVVGVMMARIMGVHDERTLDRACDLGLAFQFTNIARDVMEDRRAGRTYLPANWLDQGADMDDPAAAMPAALRLVREAEPYYRSARGGLSALPFRAAWAIAAARRIYRRIGTAMEGATPEEWAARITTDPKTKRKLVALALGDTTLSRLPLRVPSREALWTRATGLQEPYSIRTLKE